MNRLHSVDLTLDTRFGADESQHHSVQDATQRTPAHRFFIPLHYEKNYSYPLLVWLHGPAGRESEINQVMPHISVRNYVGVSVRGVVENEEHESHYDWDQDVASVDFALDDVLECVEMAQRRFNIASNRVFLVGNEAGGTMALRLALAQPDRFAGVVSLGGGLPQGDTPLRRINEAREVPVMLAHCRDSQNYTANEVCDNLRLLHSAGMAVALRVYPCDQEVTTQMLSDVDSWVMEQILGIPSNPSVYDDPTRVRLEDRN